MLLRGAGMLATRLYASVVLLVPCTGAWLLLSVRDSEGRARWGGAVASSKLDAGSLQCAELCAGCSQVEEALDPCFERAVQWAAADSSSFPLISELREGGEASSGPQGRRTEQKGSLSSLQCRA